MKTKIAITALCVGLISCSASTPIQRYSESKSNFSKGVPLMSHNYSESDLYRVYQKGATGFVTIGSLRESVEDRAEKFCARQGKGMVILGERHSPAPYILGNFPRIEIVFAAADKR
jgi:hypothetical protein